MNQIVTINVCFVINIENYRNCCFQSFKKLETKILKQFEKVRRNKLLRMTIFEKFRGKSQKT